MVWISVVATEVMRSGILGILKRWAPWNLLTGVGTRKRGIYGTKFSGLNNCKNELAIA